MAIEFRCPHCQKLFSVKDEFAGKRAKCSACQKQLTVPASVLSSPSRPASPIASPAAQSSPQQSIENVASVNPFDFSNIDTTTDPLTSNRRQRKKEQSTFDLRNQLRKMNPLYPNLPSWRQVGLITAYLVAPAILFGIYREADQSVARALASTAMGITFFPLISGLWLLLVSSRSPGLKVLGFCVTPIALPVIGITLLLLGIGFVPGAILGAVFELGRPKTRTAKSVAHIDQNVEPTVAAEEPESLLRSRDTVAVLAAVAVFLIVCPILPIVVFQITGHQILNSNLRYPVIGLAIVLAKAAHQSLAQRNRRKKRIEQVDDAEVPAFFVTPTADEKP